MITLIPEKPNQEQIVHEIVKKFQPVRTEEVKIKAMYEGVSCGDRYLRYLAEKGLITSYKKEGDSTKTWIKKEWK